jgi:hypothetical protein
MCDPSPAALFEWNMEPIEPEEADYQQLLQEEWHHQQQQARDE